MTNEQLEALKEYIEFRAKEIAHEALGRDTLIESIQRNEAEAKLYEVFGIT